METIVLDALTAGRPLAGMALPKFEGRVDLRGIELNRQEASAHSAVKVSGLGTSRAKSNLTLNSVDLRAVDMSYARLPGLRLVDSTIEDSRFVGAVLSDFRAWGFAVVDSTFEAAKMSGAVLGAADGVRVSSYVNVDFTNADLRRIVSPSASYVECDFAYARLDGTDFQSSDFVRCRFAGALRNVIFWDRGFDNGKALANTMEDVDFRQATLSLVEFRRLNLDRVLLPEDPQHLVLRAYSRTLECAIEAIRQVQGPAARRGEALLNHRYKWIGPDQTVGIFYIPDFDEYELDSPWLVELLRNCDGQT